MSKRSIVMFSNQFHERKQLKTSLLFNILSSLLLLSISPTLIASIKELRHYENVGKNRLDVQQMRFFRVLRSFFL